jgi:hypothetical protein
MKSLYIYLVLPGTNLGTQEFSKHDLAYHFFLTIFSISKPNYDNNKNNGLIKSWNKK